MMNVSQVFSRVGFWTRRKSPELLVAGAIVAAAGSIVLAIKATPKAEVVLQKANKDIKQIKADMNDDNKIANQEYSVALGKKELTRVYAKTSLELGKLYLPTAVGFTLTVASILTSHKIMQGRNVALAAAYTTLENGYRSYRERVADKVGEAAEKDIFRNVHSEEKEVTEVDKNGNEVTKTKKVKGPHVQVDSDFSVIYDHNASEWLRDTNMVLNNLAMKEKWLNQKLIYSGALFLHEVYEELGIDIHALGEQKALASRVLGWIYDPEDNSRDSYVSMGLFDKMGNRNEYAMNALRNNDQELFLEFNVDGDILTGNRGSKNFTKYRKVM
jgi:hypothetical protein